LTPRRTARLSLVPTETEPTPLQPQAAELIVGALAVGVLALTVVGAIIALRREARVGRSTGGWMLSFFLLGPLAVAGYFLVHAGVQQAEVPTRQ
jgi:uncharacterized membrane protein (DUF4010 family)